MLMVHITRSQLEILVPRGMCDDVSKQSLEESSILKELHLDQH